MTSRHIALTLSLLVATVATAALIPDMKFRRLDTREGLSSSQVNCVLKDRKGFVWIGTAYGLNRYDGYRVKTFYSNKRDTTSMRDNYVDKIFEAYDGRLWLKQGMNYCIYDPVTERFERNVEKELEKFGISGGIDRIYIDSKKNFWVKLYEQGVFYYNPYTKRLFEFKLGYDKQQFNPTYGVSSFAECGSNMVLTTNCGEMVCLNGETGWISWESKWMRRHGGPENMDYHLRIDRQGNYWVVTEGYTFIYVQRERRWYKSVPQFLRAHGIEGVPDELHVWDLLVDRHGWVWLATDHEGLIVIDVKGRQAKQFLNSKYDETTISDNTSRHLYQDNTGSVWIGTYKNGVNQYRESLSNFRNVDLGDVNVVCEDRYGHYWVGTNDRGIIVYDPATGEQLQHYTVDNSGLSSNIMVGGYAASDGSIWFGSYNGGLVHCVPQGDASQGTATIVNYRATGNEGDLANNNVWSVTEDRWHRVWIGTLGSGVQMLDLKTGKFRTWDTKNTQIPSDYMTSIGWIKKGWLMVGTSYYYSLVNPVTGKLLNQTLPEDPSITVNTSNTSTIMEDSRGLIWQGSTSGATVYDPKTQAVTLLDMTSGLYGSSVCSIVEDKRHAMWVVTDHGVSRVIPQQQDDRSWQFVVRSFNSRDGLQQGTYNQRSTCITRSGLLLVGGQGGLDIIEPNRLHQSQSAERPVFSGLLLYDQEVKVGGKVNGRVILDEALDKSRRLSLRYYENNFTIQLASDAGSVRNSKRFVYKLEGFHDQWVKTSELNPNISFISLRYGDYKLYVRMLNDDGTVGDVESRLDIHISQPLWRTRWALLLYMVAVLAGVWWWRRYFLRRQAERMQLEQLRRETEKKQWMSEMRKQMASQQPQPAAGDGQEAPLPMQPEKADLVGFVKLVVSRFEAPQDKRVKLSFQSEADQLDAYFDPARLGQAVQILLANSVKFSPSDCKIQVSVDCVGPRLARIAVADHGVGVPDEAKSHVFEPIMGEDASLRLDLVKTIAEAHKGTVALADNEGGGSVFSITLPCEKVVEVEEAVIIDDGSSDDE